MGLDFYNALLFFVSLFLLTIATVSLQKQKEKASNKYLGLFFLILGITIFFRFLEVSKLILKVPHAIELDFPFCFLMSPFYLFFIKSYIDDYKPSTKEKLLQSIPAIAVFVFLIPVFLLNTSEKLEYIIHEASSSYSWRYQILNTAFYIQTVGYLIYTLFLLKKYSVNESEELTNKIKWLRILTITLLCVKFLILIIVLSINKDKKFEHTPITAISVLVLILVWLLQKSELLNTQQKENSEDDDVKIKYKNSFLSNEDISNHAHRISSLIDEKRLFLDKEISISSLSKELDLPTRTISEVINRHFSCSFNDFINRLRIDYSKTLLLENTPAMKIDFIGEEAGFSSRATFYSNFKKNTGLSPSDFVKKHKAA